MGVIADVDCPEFVGTTCRFHDDRGAAPPTVVPRSEVGLLASELALDYLTPRYQRRVRRLREAPEAARGAEFLASAATKGPAALSAPDVVESAPARRRLLVADAPLNVPADHDDRRARGHGRSPIREERGTRPS